MKARFLLALILTLSLHATAQQRRNSSGAPMKKSGCPAAYIGFSTGINNLNGMLGPNVDVVLSNTFSIGAGVGFSSWGTKIGAEGRYYFSPARCNRGWALGAGITHSTGARNTEVSLQVYGSGNDTRPVTLDLQSKTNLFISAYHFFKLGRSNRFHLTFGHSVPLSETRYTNKSPYILTENSDAVVRFISPGGLIAGLGFSFGAGRR